MTAERARVVLTADDYAMTEGVSRGIEELARARRLSAAGAMVTFRHWSELGRRFAALRGDIATGLHFNLTLGAPLGAMPKLAPGGRLPSIGRLTRMATLERLDLGEIEAEATRQLDAFEQHLDAPPDYLDGHQHAHALPQVRDALLSVLARRTWTVPLLIRDPGAGWTKAGCRGHVAKAWILAALTSGFARKARALGFVTNDTFGGVTDFAPDEAASELSASMRSPGKLHVAMCHPGHADAELVSLDPVTVRRERELAALLSMRGLEQRIWHPRRSAGGPPVDWTAELAA